MCSCRVWSPGEPVMWQPEHSWKTAREKNASNLSHFSSSTGTLSLFKQQLEPYSLLCDKSHETIILIQKHCCSEKTPQHFFLLLFIFNHVACRRWILFRQQTTSVNRWGGLKCIKSPEESLLEVKTSTFPIYFSCSFVMQYNRIYLPQVSINVIAMASTEDFDGISFWFWFWFRWCLPEQKLPSWY